MGLFSVVWVVIAAALVTIEVAGRLRLFGLAPLGATLSSLRDRAVGRAALVIGWMWLGWHLFAR